LELILIDLNVPEVVVAKLFSERSQIAVSGSSGFTPQIINFLDNGQWFNAMVTKGSLLAVRGFMPSCVRFICIF